MNRRIPTPLVGGIMGFEFSDSAYKDVNYPPYNDIEIGNNRRIEIAVAGFHESEIDITFKDSHLCVSGNSRKGLPTYGEPKTSDDEGMKFNRRGIAMRPFTLTWKVSPEYEVAGATITDGILTIDFNYVEPVHAEGQKIEIKRTVRSELFEGASSSNSGKEQKSKKT